MGNECPRCVQFCIQNASDEKAVEIQACRVSESYQSRPQAQKLSSLKERSNNPPSTQASISPAQGNLTPAAFHPPATQVLFNPTGNSSPPVQGYLAPTPFSPSGSQKYSPGQGYLNPQIASAPLYSPGNIGYSSPFAPQRSFAPLPAPVPFAPPGNQGYSSHFAVQEYPSPPPVPAKPLDTQVQSSSGFQGPAQGYRSPVPAELPNLQSKSPCPASNYFSAMEKYRFSSCKLPPAVATSPDLRRVNTEMRALATDLPCEATAAVFVRVDESSLHHMQALISGVEGTPYAHGLFLFDVILPNGYPAVPPHVSLLTTGNSTVRFNPNLYNNGYLCLSILNTWAGPPEEQWRPNYSTLFQVFVSIQSVVMTSNIANHEPSFEALAEHSIENIEYRWIVKYQTIVWGIIDMIRHPPLGFEEVVRNHFRIKRDAILKDVEQWTSSVSSAPSFSSPLASSQNPATVQKFHAQGVAASFHAACKEVKDELGRL